MSDQPKSEIRRGEPTGEWTGLILSRLIKQKGYKGAADSRNTALAAEREKARMLVDALKSIKSQLCANFPLGTNREIIQEIDDALAKVKEGK